MTDKRKPHYPLKHVKLAASEGRCKVTLSAQKTADSIGFSLTEIVDVVADLRSSEFYKSTTDNCNSASWQDVYKVYERDLDLYLKLKLIEQQGQTVLVLSFKLDESPGGK